MKLRRIIDHHKLRHTIAFPRILDGRKLATDIGFRKDCVLEAPHYGQAARRLETSAKAHRAACMLIKGRGDRRTPERQHRVVVHDEDVAGGVIHRHSLERAGCLGADAAVLSTAAKKHGLRIESTKSDDGERRYQLKKK
jgi:hypothetical protein